jgi:hypothetical protein
MPSRRKLRKIKGGDCGCNANHVIGQPMTGGGFLNPVTFTPNTLPDNSYYQYNSSIGTISDPQSTGLNGNLISARNLADMSSSGGGRKKRLSKYKKGGNPNEIMNEKVNAYMTNAISLPGSLIKGGNAHTYNNNYLDSYKYSTDHSPYISANLRGGKSKKVKKSNKRKSKKAKKGEKTKRTKKTIKGGVTPYSLFNSQTNPILSFGTTQGAYNAASIATANGQLGDNAGYNVPSNTGYGPNNPYLI